MYSTVEASDAPSTRATIVTSAANTPAVGARGNLRDQHRIN